MAEFSQVNLELLQRNTRFDQLLSKLSESEKIHQKTRNNLKETYQFNRLFPVNLDIIFILLLIYLTF